MNKLALAITFSFVATLCFGQAIQEKEVPGVVASKLKALYPGADKVVWEMEDGFYEANFKQNKEETSVLISYTGTLVRTEVELDKAAWPSVVKSFLGKQPGALKADEVDKITDIYGKVTYEVEAGDMEYVLDDKGTLISKKAIEEEDDED